MTDQTAMARNRVLARIVIGVLIAILAIFSATHIRPSDDAVTLASRALGGIAAVLSLYLIASGIKSLPSSGTCNFSRSNTVEGLPAERRS